MPHFQGTEDMLGFIHLVKDNNDNTYKLTTDYDTFTIHPDWKFSSDEEDSTFVYTLYFMINEAFYRFNFYMDTSNNNKILWLNIYTDDDDVEQNEIEISIDTVTSDDKNIYLS